ncbi:hypothetical protein EU642_21900 [Salmonella enterica]|nr:hypothetical protein [Salmonella enterica]EAR6391506.1 hypothetical protein [Salmonella enterica]EAV1285270.1 hypothetical protein [Salmonella enterica]
MADEKDDVSVEGSAARIADRGRDQLGFDEGGDDRPNLGNPSDVADLVADFCLEVIQTRNQYLNDELGAEDAKDAIRVASRIYGRIIMGQDKHYRHNVWHSPDRLGARIPKVVQPIEGVTHAGELLFVTLAASLSSLSVAVEAGRITDAAARQHIIDLQRQAGDLIVGVGNAGSV